MMKTYYHQEKKAFWTIQVLMGCSVFLGLVWVLGLIGGLNNLNDANYLTQFNSQFLDLFYAQNFFAWLVQVSLAGLLGVLMLYLSYQIGVSSIIRFQVEILQDILKTINQPDATDWLNVVANEPRKKTHRVLKTSVQLTGLVVRRLVRMMIPLITFLAAFVALLKLDAQLLVYLIPLAMIYLVLLYFINRNAARNQVKLTAVSETTNRKIGNVIDDMLFQNKSYGTDTVAEIEATDYRYFSLLRYRRRLAEIHVMWVNSLFLILGSALIIIAYSSFGQTGSIDWLQLILFLVALRYAGSGLQEMASATVAFSRFLPDTEMVYQLLNPMIKNHTVLSIKGDVIFYFNSNQDIGVLIPQVLKLNHGVEQSQQLDEETIQQFKNKEVNFGWYYSVKPSYFKQSVRKLSGHISKVLVYDNGVLDCYDVNEFLVNFDPKAYQKQKTSHKAEEDELY